jgi:biopolymer transport protein ExbB/TolQ
MNLSFLNIIRQGGVTMWVIIALSIVAVAVAAERLAAMWNFMDRARVLADTVNRCLSRGAIAEGRTACERSKSPLADVLLVGFERHGRSSEGAVEAAVDRARLRMNIEMKNRLWILGTIGATAPFLGLFGTVIGIMAAFNALGEHAGGGLNVVAPGIADALITTALGIAVAVEAVIIYNFFNQRIARQATELKLLIEEFLEFLKGENKEVADGARQSS